MTQPRNHRSRPSPSTRPHRRRAGIGAVRGTTLAVVMLLAIGGHATAQEDRPPTPDLDLTSLEAETEYGTLRAQRAETSFVAPLGEGQAIGITFLDGADGEPLEIFVRLYHRQLAGGAVAELDADGRATLHVARGDMSELDAIIDVTLSDDGASGTVTLMGETSEFGTSAATGDAGVYEAWGTDESDDTRCQWVVLPDGRQWGCICTPPFIGPCCRWGFMH